MCVYFFFFKQKTAYEMRISDWSSDVCSSDLTARLMMTAVSSVPPGGHRWPVAILGATGAVGQTFIRCLRNHPWFDVAEVAASERSAGKLYADARSEARRVGKECVSTF